MKPIHIVPFVILVSVGMLFVMWLPIFSGQ